MQQPLELLLVSSETKDPFATVIVDPKSCVATWSYKGSELQGAVTGCVEPVGQRGDLMFISVKDQPLAHIFAVNGRDRFHQKTVLNKPLQSVVISKDGGVIFGSIDSRIFTWMVATGELVSVVNAHFQNITCLCLSADDGLLVSGGSDGTVIVFEVSDLMSWDLGGLETVKPYRQWRVHSLAVTDLSVTCLANAHILSSSMDHTAALYSLTMNECLLKISGDRPVTASCIDPAENSLYLGTDKGPIIQFHLYSLEGTNEKILTSSAVSHKADDFFFLGHSAEVTRVTVNHDCSLLASGDAHGKYIVWDALSRQCLRSVTTKGSICKLQFILNWESIRNLDYPKVKIPVSVLQRTRSSPAERRSIMLKAESPLKGVVDERFVGDHLHQLFEKYSELLHSSVDLDGTLCQAEGPSSSLNDENDGNDNVVIVEKDVEMIDSVSAAKTVSLSGGAQVEAENTELKVRNAELLAELKKLKAELAHVKKKNQEIFEFATDLVLENRPPK